MAAHNEAIERLKGLLKTLSSSEEASPLSVAQLEFIGQSLLSDSQAKGLAVLCLSVFGQKTAARSLDSDNASSVVISALRPYTERVFNTRTEASNTAVIGDEDRILAFTLVIANLFPFAPVACVKDLTDPFGTEEESWDSLGMLLELAELPGPLRPALAELLGQAAGTKQGREMVRARATEWLQGAVNLQTADGDLGVLCAVALSKLDNGARPDTEVTPAEVDEVSRMRADAGLANKMIKHIMSHSHAPSSCRSAIEGLGILTTKSYIKELVCQTPKALKSILALSPVLGPRPSSLPQTPRGSIDFNDKSLAPVETALCYGLTVVLVNLTARRPKLSGEDEQIERLRRMAISGKKGGGGGMDSEEDPFETDEAVRARVKSVIAAGGITALSELSRADSRSVKLALGHLCLALVEDQANRPMFIRDGGFKVLSSVVRDLLAPSTSEKSTPVAIHNGSQSGSDADVLVAAQALAKLIITTAPHLLFPPPHLTTSLNALSPMYILMAHPSSTLLQIFESLMALTNLASIGADVSKRILTDTCTPPRADEMWRGSGREDTIRITTKIEELLLADNQLVRRAATELVCNLAGSAEGIAYYSGGPASSPEGKSQTAKAKSRLQVLLIITHVEDLPTQLAAGGALAILTESPHICDLLLDLSSAGKTTPPSRNVWKRIIGMLEPEIEPEQEGEEPIPLISSSPPDEGLLLRAVVILSNLVTRVISLEQEDRVRHVADAKTAGVDTKLDEIIKTRSSDDLLEPANSALQLFKQTSF
ncbi:hypothetical protein BD324DRAFT_632026 [Kockovaella imperatae]|uniref:UNC-45/Cro1/She4 central domain-containing protein n=1 Tax=Kockovaella imperatae TaxID=4999 RepID=A0A1Y1UCM7_9TREE|nr:hypothetical protein BD324DRAFT_632026 [Kockovaella imperatae]ORX35256.1 hypothetical protein BD324DRAFT_632026 [Kockovaella imperatae]